jgi:hypothetical protein
MMLFPVPGRTTGGFGGAFEPVGTEADMKRVARAGVTTLTI